VHEIDFRGALRFRLIAEIWKRFYSKPVCGHHVAGPPKRRKSGGLFGHEATPPAVRGAWESGQWSLAPPALSCRHARAQECTVGTC